MPDGQEPLIKAIADALEDRGATAAAALVRDTDPVDDVWNNYVGPMLDELERDYTVLASEVRNALAGGSPSKKEGRVEDGR